MVFWTVTRRSITSNHDRCQNGRNCTGPGCRIQTGKTERKRRRR